jgi:ABC-2 type transport system permease protein
MLGYALLVRALLDIFFNYNLAFISRRIGRGQLDHLLIQPQPLWAALVTEGFAPLTGSGMLLPAVFLLLVSGRSLDLPLSPAWYGLFFVDVISSITIVLSFEYAWGSIAFWAPRGAEEINSRTWTLITTLSPFPLDGLAGWALASLLTLVPVGLIAWVPSRALLGIDAPSWTSAALVPAAAVVFAALSTWIFRRGLHHYGRTGSSRYLDYAHRR